MTVSASHVYLYAATTGDLVKCFAAADIAGIPYANCTGNFQTAWKMAANASTLVIAVGEPLFILSTTIHATGRTRRQWPEVTRHLSWSQVAGALPRRGPTIW
ncbi:hypothetical protein GCM10025858_30540 [Alicyclobacillus sacchari]|uniref:hypothetical protein n=1 Tax=Alicyclobacillus sacchari TaxID=392010 RepID=UPI0023EA0057|nr:hypothetical protein [Alicyclobacillus sacchari]GMA58551.1 hypothetical protein GCM10025858_30540 [Alicyclobacillus sacchari]